MTPYTLDTIAAELRAKLERIEILKKKQAEIDREIALLTSSSGQDLFTTAKESVRAVSRPRALSSDPSQPKTQRQWLVHLLKEHGPMTRDELFEMMLSTGKRPANAEQLSALLSREKKTGSISVDPKTAKWIISGEVSPHPPVTVKELFG